MTMVTAERIDSLATSENQAARGVRIYRQRRGAIQGFLPIFGTWHHSHPNTSTHFQDIMKSMQSVCAPAGPRTPALPAYFQDQVISFSRRKKQRRPTRGKNKNNSWVTQTCVWLAASREGQLFLKSPVRWWRRFIGKIITGVFQSFNVRSGICFWWPTVRVQGQV